MAAGHTCWGIQNSCATGKVMSEFVFEGAARSADVRELDPGLVIGGGEREGKVEGGGLV